MEANNKKIDNFKIFIPVLASIIAIGIHKFLPNSRKYTSKALPYYFDFLVVLLVIFIGITVAASINKKVKGIWSFKSYFIGAAVMFLTLYDVLTIKTMILPQLYFPCPDKIFGVFFEDWQLMIKCFGYSSKLLLTGFFVGAAAGLLTGISVGWSDKFSYWLNPLIKVAGPIPSTAWIPIALVAFPNTFSASVFLIALGVWFPTTVLTSSGISNVKQAYFEVSSTLGSTPFQNITKIAVPAAMPSMFIGLFNGACSSFITLMTAEMIGVKYGIGWYVNWQREMMAYSNVYAGLIVIAITFSLIITILFKVRDRVLVWQKGVIKW